MRFTGRFWTKSVLIFLVLTSLVLLFHFTKHWVAEWEGLWNRIATKVTDAWDYLVQIYQTVVGFLYSLYARGVLLTLAIYLIKYIITGVCSYNMIKKYYISSRERIMKLKMELEDRRLQAQVMETKLSVCEAEFKELLEKEAEKLQACSLRARLRGFLPADDTPQRTPDWGAPRRHDPALGNIAPDEERDCIMELLKELMKDQTQPSDAQGMKMDCGEQVPPPEMATTDQNSNSIYGSLSDDANPECTVKIFRVTNVYKVAYLRHFVKQKKMRKATRHAMLKKKIEAMKSLFDEWQKTLNRVINIRLPIDAASEEAQGDHSKQNLQLSDSETELVANRTNAYFDDIHCNWTQNQYRPYQYEGLQEASAREIYEDYESSKYATPAAHAPPPPPFPLAPHHSGNTDLFVLPEETSSQVAIEEVKSDHDMYFETEGRDLIEL